MFLTDKPIESFNEDTLGRSDFARSLALAILKHKQHDNLSIGLCGGWGFGKTSIINMSLEYINSLSKDEEYKPIIIKFNPWNFSEQNQLIYQFFKHLSFIFSQSDSQELQKAAEKLIEIAKIFQPLSLNSLFAAFSELSSRPENSTDSTNNLQDLNHENLDYLKEEINELLKSYQNKIIIVIDDIDRLNSSEMRQIFQLVKSIADFSNTVYILSFNKNLVLKTLEDTLKGCSGSDYIEDIIQVPFSIPTISETKISNLLYSEIEELLKNDNEGFIEDYWNIIYNCGLKKFFKDIRNINRYLNVLKFDFELVRSEINIVEFFTITALQVFEPYIYDEIKNNKELFCYGKILNNSSNAETIDKITRTSFNKIIQKREKLSEEELKYLLSWLFPKVDYLCDNSPSEVDLSRFKIDPSIADSGNFDTYFKSAILETKVSSKKITKLISSFKDPQKFKEVLLKMENYEIDDFLTRLVNPDQFSILSKFLSTSSQEELDGIIISLIDSGDILYNKHLIDINKINNIIIYFINEIEDLNYRFNILKQSVTNSKDNIYISSLTIYNCIVNRVIINQEHIYELREIIRNKIETYEKLYKHENLALILAIFKRLGYRSQVNYCIEKIKRNDENFIHLISTLLNKGERLKGAGVRADSIRILLPLLEMDTRLKEISSTTNFEKFDEHKKYILGKIAAIIKSAKLSTPDRNN